MTSYAADFSSIGVVCGITDITHLIICLNHLFKTITNKQKLHVFKHIKTYLKTYLQLPLFGVKKHFNLTSFIFFDQSSSDDPTSSFKLGDSQVKSE